MGIGVIATVRRNWAFARHLRPHQLLRRLQLNLLRQWRVRYPPRAEPCDAAAALRADLPPPLMQPRGGLERTPDDRWRFTFLNRTREFAWPISPENHALMHRILDHAWGFHGRVASREQVQIQISFPHHKDWVDLFMGWWEYGFRSWRRRAPNDATLTFLCELGPKEYAMTGPDGYELSDRWEEARTMMAMVRALWQRLEDEDRAATAARTAGAGRVSAA